jgi:hypothetical protein
MKRLVRSRNKLPKVSRDDLHKDRSVKMPNKLPHVLKDLIEEDSLSLAVDVDDNLGIIEVADCVDLRTRELQHAVQRLIERAGTYTEYIPRCGGIRMIGMSYGQPIDLNCHGSSGLSDFTISIHRNCDRWVDISGIPIVDNVFGCIDKLIDELVADMENYLYLR